tara:strand:- start:2295 stop:2609 length:315 start_codon:yes stop_codon:yes gene_type:complete
MGNICEIFSAKNRNEYVINTIPIATPMFEIDGSGNHQKSSVQYGTPVESPLHGQYRYPPIQYGPNGQPVVIVQQPVMYNDPASSAMTGFLGGMLIGDMLDNDCY